MAGDLEEPGGPADLVQFRADDVRVAGDIHDRHVRHRDSSRYSSHPGGHRRQMPCPGTTATEPAAILTQPWPPPSGNASAADMLTSGQHLAVPRRRARHREDDYGQSESWPASRTMMTVRPTPVHRKPVQRSRARSKAMPPGDLFAESGPFTTGRARLSLPPSRRTRRSRQTFHPHAEMRALHMHVFMHRCA